MEFSYSILFTGHSFDLSQTVNDLYSYGYCLQPSVIKYRMHFYELHYFVLLQLFDMQTLDALKTYRTERPVNSASISPLFDHVSYMFSYITSLLNLPLLLLFYEMTSMYLFLQYIYKLLSAWLKSHWCSLCPTVVMVCCNVFLDDDIWQICFQVVVGGGQEAMSVTTTSTKIGKFDARFFHLVFEEEFGSVKGHFGPINSLSFHPDGKR